MRCHKTEIRSHYKRREFLYLLFKLTFGAEMPTGHKKMTEPQIIVSDGANRANIEVTLKETSGFNKADGIHDEIAAALVEILANIPPAPREPQQLRIIINLYNRVTNRVMPTLYILNSPYKDGLECVKAELLKQNLKIC